MAHLEHLEWLGVDTVWISPVTVSPNADYGYDVADYCDVDPTLGTLADLDALSSRRRRGPGIRVLLDLVPNHTSIEHPWFVDARSGARRTSSGLGRVGLPPARRRPTEQLGQHVPRTGVVLDETTGQYYLHNFLPEQPDLNWWNDAVRDEFDRILHFWFDRGVAGFRIMLRRWS